MVINSTLIFCLIPELEEAFKGNKILQVLQSSDKFAGSMGKELLFLTRNKEKEASLFFCAHPDNYRIEILDENETKTREHNYQKTNLFSYAIGGHIQEIKQVDFDRVIRFSCLKKSQLGPNIEFDLIFELTGRNSNLILLRKDGLIIDCLRKVDLTQNRLRQILPGEKYLPPPSPKKRNPFQMEEEKFTNLLKDHDLLVSEFLISHFVGLDQLLSEKIIFEANLPLSVTTKDLNEQNIKDLWKDFSQTFQEISEHKLTFQVVKSEIPPKAGDEVGKPQAISCVNLPFVKDAQKIFCVNLNSAIKTFFSQKLEEQQKKIELKKFFEVAQGVFERLERRKEKIEEDLRQAEKFEQYKRFGDLLMMNKDLIKKGQDSVKLMDIFQPEQSSVEIPLNVKLSPTQNAQAYFKKYKKAKDALVTMRRRRAETNKEILPIEKILKKLEQRIKELRLEEIKSELISLGFLKAEKLVGKRKKIKKEFSPKGFVTKNGGEILVGRNDKENDYLTFRFAQPDDLWFHAQDVPGSHVVLRRKEKKREPSSSDIREAAQVAAYFSKARRSKKVSVIYTLTKHVKKPKKGKPGLALVEKEKTILVEPKLANR